MTHADLMAAGLSDEFFQTFARTLALFLVVAVACWWTATAVASWQKQSRQQLTAATTGAVLMGKIARLEAELARLRSARR